MSQVYIYIFIFICMFIYRGETHTYIYIISNTRHLVLHTLHTVLAWSFEFEC